MRKYLTGYDIFLTFDQKHILPHWSYMQIIVVLATVILNTNSLTTKMYF